MARDRRAGQRRDVLAEAVRRRPDDPRSPDRARPPVPGRPPGVPRGAARDRADDTRTGHDYYHYFLLRRGIERTELDVRWAEDVLRELESSRVRTPPRAVLAAAAIAVPVSRRPAAGSAGRGRHVRLARGSHGRSPFAFSSADGGGGRARRRPRRRTGGRPRRRAERRSASRSPDDPQRLSFDGRLRSGMLRGTVRQGPHGACSVRRGRSPALRRRVSTRSRRPHDRRRRRPYGNLLGVDAGRGEVRALFRSGRDVRDRLRLRDSRARRRARFEAGAAVIDGRAGGAPCRSTTGGALRERRSRSRDAHHARRLGAARGGRLRPRIGPTTRSFLPELSASSRGTASPSWTTTNAASGNRGARTPVRRPGEPTSTRRDVERRRAVPGVGPPASTRPASGSPGTARRDGSYRSPRRASRRFASSSCSRADDLAGLRSTPTRRLAGQDDRRST